MNKKYSLLFKGWLYAAVTLFMLSMPLWANVNDTFGLVVLLALAAYFGFLSFSHFKQATTAIKTERPDTPPPDEAVTEQVNFYSRFIYISLIVFPLISWKIISYVGDLEYGRVEFVMIWAPLYKFYLKFGYQTTILTMPLLGVVVVFGLLWKVYALKSGGADKSI